MCILNDRKAVPAAPAPPPSPQGSRSAPEEFYTRETRSVLPSVSQPRSLRSPSASTALLPSTLPECVVKRKSVCVLCGSRTTGENFGLPGKRSRGGSTGTESTGKVARGQRVVRLPRRLAGWTRGRGNICRAPMSRALRFKATEKVLSPDPVGTGLRSGFSGRGRCFICLLKGESSMAGSDGLSRADANGLLGMSSSQSERDPRDRGQADGPESAGRRTIEHTMEEEGTQS